MAELAASGNVTAADAPGAASTSDEERTRRFFQKNLQVRSKLNVELKKSQDKRFKLREDFGADADVFDKWRGEQSQGLNIANMTLPPRTVSADSLLVTRTEAITLNENSNNRANRTEVEKGDE